MSLPIREPYTPSTVPAATLANIVLYSSLGVTITQIVHELTHGLAALLTGKQVLSIGFFYSLSLGDSPVFGEPWGEILVAGSASVVNILCALGCIALFARFPRRPSLRLFLLYFGAYSVFGGFGYLLVGSLFGFPGGIRGDWAGIADLLGGGWEVRGPMLAAGILGTLLGCFWVGWAATHFTSAGARNRRERLTAAMSLCVVPYLVSGILASVWGLFHPFGHVGWVITMMQAWMGYSGLLWAGLVAYVGLRRPRPALRLSVLPDNVNRPALLLVVLSGAVVSLVLIPGVDFN